MCLCKTQSQRPFFGQLQSIVNRVFLPPAADGLALIAPHARKKKVNIR
jgi:hypothetical protein